MFIRLFRSSFSYQVILLVTFALLLWLPAFIHPKPMPDGISVVPVYNYLLIKLQPFPLLVSIIAFILTLMEAILLNLFLSGKDLAPRNSALPAYMFILLCGWQPETLTLSPSLLAIFFLILFLYFFLKVYESPDAFREVFSSAFCIAIASFFNFHVLLLVLAIWIGFIVFRVLNWREWLISVIGILSPYSLVVAFFFLRDDMPALISDLDAITHAKAFFPGMNAIRALIWGLLAFFIMAALWKVLNILQEKVISLRKNFLFIIWFFLISLLLLPLAGETYQFQVLVLCVPASVLIAYHLSFVRRMVWWESLFAVLIILVIIIRLL